MSFLPQGWATTRSKYTSWTSKQHPLPFWPQTVARRTFGISECISRGCKMFLGHSSRERPKHLWQVVSVLVPPCRTFLHRAKTSAELGPGSCQGAKSPVGDRNISGQLLPLCSLSLGLVYSLKCSIRMCLFLGKRFRTCLTFPGCTAPVGLFYLQKFSFRFPLKEGN